MIHLDTNYLIGLAVHGTPEAFRLRDWMLARETLCASAVAWSEFLNGPVTDAQIALAESFIESRIVPFGREEAVLAAKLFNRSGRRRGTQSDCFISATAILANARLATNNRADFQRFASYGLKLA